MPGEERAEDGSRCQFRRPFLTASFDRRRIENGDGYEGTISGRAYVLGMSGSIGAVAAVGNGINKGVKVVSGSMFKNRKSLMKALSDEDNKKEEKEVEEDGRGGGV